MTRQFRLMTAYGSRIADAVQLAAVDGAGAQAELGNAPTSTRVHGLETLAVWRLGGGKFIANYGYARGSRPDAETGTREPLSLLPRHRVGGDLMLERPGVYRMGIEGTWYAAQPLDDNPYRTVEVWAPLEGFMANVALRYRWR